MEADKEELHWEQRAHVNWLQYGDKNTLFFHSHASYRKRENAVNGLFDGHGNWLIGEAELLNLAGDYFKDLFTASTPVDSSTITDLVQLHVTDEMNGRLLAAFTSDEVNILFGEASDLQSTNMKALLITYGRVSGQRVNYEKSLIYFSENVS
ncbi:hypothetical protein V6N13_029595 [Hibiscus sabdariffa]